MNAANPNQTAEQPSEASFRSAVKTAMTKIGRPATIHSMKVWFAANSPAMPVKYKTVLWASIAYLVSPIDLIPDVTPIVGFTDDVGVITAALAYAHLYITDEITEKAHALYSRTFGAW